MKVTIDKDFNAKMNLGTDYALKKQGLAALSFGETERVRELKDALKKSPDDEKLKTDMKFAQAENSKLRANVKNALKEAGVNFDYGKIEGSFAKQEWKKLGEDEKDFKKGAYVINQENLEKLADFLKNKGVEKVQVETSYLGNIKKYQADHLYMAEVKKVRNSNVYSAQVGAHYDPDKKQFLMNTDGLKKGMDIEKKDDLILKSAMGKNLDSIKEVYQVAGLDNEGNIKNMQKKSQDLVSFKENGESVLLTQKYFFGGMKKEEYQNSPDEVKAVLNDINKDRIAALKENFKGASFDKELKSFVFLKTDNPEFEKKFEEYKANDLKFCEEKAKELEALRPEVKVKQEVNNFTKNFGNSDFVQSKPQGVALA
jgi:hypothetical protein